MEKNIMTQTHIAKCPHCLGDIEKHYREWGDWYFVCVDCKRTVPSASFQYVPIAEHFNHIENNHIKEATLNRVATNDKKRACEKPYDIIVQDEEWELIGNGVSREQDTIDKIIHKMR